MAMTKIRGTTQILEKSITSAQLADDAAIKLAQLEHKNSNDGNLDEYNPTIEICHHF